jgi:hypothetical protein
MNVESVLEITFCSKVTFFFKVTQKRDLEKLRVLSYLENDLKEQLKKAACCTMTPLFK